MSIKPTWSCEKIEDSYMIKAEFKRHGNTIRCVQCITDREMKQAWYTMDFVKFRIEEINHYLKEFK